MCLMVYIASDKPLPLISWVDGLNQNICVLELDKDNKVVKKHFSKEYVYCVGANEGCGCGFCYSFTDLIDEEDIQDQEAAKKSVEELFEFVKCNSKVGETFEVYSCWADNEGKEKDSSLDRIIDLSTFIFGDYFKFEENQFTLLKT